MKKKILAAILSIVTVVSCMVMPVTEAAEIDYSLLSMVGVSVDLQNPDAEITRIELAEMAIALTKSSLITEGKAVFVDIPQKHKLFTTINTVYLNGLMTGYSDGSFRPDEPANVADAYPMLISVLGYNIIMENGVMSQDMIKSYASKTGLSKGVGSGTLTNLKLAKILTNLTEAKIVEPGSIANDVIKFTEGDDYLQSITGYKTIKGQVQAVGGASLSGIDTVDYGVAVINGDRYDYSGIDMINYLGYEVKAVVDENEGKIISVTLNRRIEELVIDAADIENYANYRYTYETNQSRIKYETIDVSTKIILNGKNMVYNEELMKPQLGKVRFVDSDRNGDTDLLIIESGLYYNVDSVKPNEQITDDITGHKINLEDAKTECWNGDSPTTMDSITKGSYIEVYPDDLVTETADNGNKYLQTGNPAVVKIKISDSKMIEGSVNGRTIDTVRIDEEEYIISDYILNIINAGFMKSPSLSAKITAYVNQKNQIIGYDIQSKFETGDNIHYGWLINVFEDEDNVIDEYNAIGIRIIDETAKPTVLYSAKNMKVNGKKKTYNELKLVPDLEHTNTTLFNSDGTVRRQLVAYELNSENKITNLHVAIDYSTQYLYDATGKKLTTTPNPDYRKPGYEGYDEENFSLDYTAGTGTTLYRGGINHLYSFGTNTIGFFIPKNTEDYKRYKVVSGNIASNISTNVYYNFKVYNADKYYTVGALVVDYSAVDTVDKRDGAWEIAYGRSQITIILEDEEVYSEAEEKVVRNMSGAEFAYSQTEKYTGVIKDKVALICDDPEFEDTDTRYNGAGDAKPYGYVKWKDLTVGDCILHSFDDAGNISSFTVLFKYSDLYNADGSVNYKVINQRFDSERETTILGTISQIVDIGADGSIIFVPSADTSDYTNYMKTDTKNIFIFNQKLGKGEVGTADDLEKGDTIVTRSHNGSVYEMFVYR